MEITPILVTVLIAIITLSIAFKQFKTSQAQLKASLFEKRYLIFEAAWAELSGMLQVELTNPLPISNPSFTNLFPKASFLFGSEIEQYLKLISSKKVELSTLLMRQNFNPTQEEISKRLELETWVSEQISNIKQVFLPYLDFSSWK